MGWKAYNYGGRAYEGTEEGYFSPGKLYRYISSSAWWEETTGPAATCPSPWNSINNSRIYGGACLNYHYMSRLDLVRWAITGGTPKTCTGTKRFNNGECDPELWDRPGNGTKVGSVCNDTLGGCILRTTNSVYVRVPWSRVNDSLASKFKSLKVQPRMGAMFYSGTSVRSEHVYIGDFLAPNSTENAFPYMNLISHINSSSPSGATPTGPAMWDALNYFRQTADEYGGIPPQSGSGDRWKNPMYVCDGGGSNCVSVPCARNFVILMSDGQWNVGGAPTPSGTCSIETGFEDHSADPVVPAYKMHSGFTNAKTGESTSVSATYAIGLFLGGSGEKSLIIDVKTEGCAGRRVFAAGDAVTFKKEFVGGSAYFQIDRAECDGETKPGIKAIQVLK